MSAQPASLSTRSAQAPRVLRLRGAEIGRQPGERARLKVMDGPDAGLTFVLVAERASVGRGEENDAILTDLRTSRRHAQIVWERGAWWLRDAGSQNGVAINGVRVASGGTAPLTLRDTVQLGGTLLEFVPAEAGTRLLLAPPRPAAQVAQEQALMAQQIERVRRVASRGPQLVAAASRAAGGWLGASQGAGPNRTVVLTVVAGLVFAGLYGPWDLLGPSPAPKSGARGGSDARALSTEGVRDLASMMQRNQSASTRGPDGARTAETFFRSGFREYREKNYIRAKSQFETVLQLDANHVLARLYLTNSNLAIDESVKFHLERGKRSRAAGKEKDAIGHFESVLRLLYRDPRDARYEDARAQLKELLDGRRPR